jgi:hypothetical protein
VLFLSETSVEKENRQADKITEQHVAPPWRTGRLLPDQFVPLVITIIRLGLTFCCSEGVLLPKALRKAVDLHYDLSLIYFSSQI